MKEAVLSRVKKLLFAVVLMFGVVGMAGPASAVKVHQEATVDTDQITPASPPIPGTGALLSLCIVIGAGNPATCIIL